MSELKEETDAGTSAGMQQMKEEPRPTASSSNDEPQRLADAEPEISEIPTHRVEVEKDPVTGNMREIIITIKLPGVSNMQCVDLDVAESKLQLQVCEPRYALNICPFVAPVQPESC